MDPIFRSRPSRSNGQMLIPLSVASCQDKPLEMPSERYWISCPCIGIDGRSGDPGVVREESDVKGGKFYLFCRFNLFPVDMGPVVFRCGEKCTFKNRKYCCWGSLYSVAALDNSDPAPYLSPRYGIVFSPGVISPFAQCAKRTPKTFPTNAIRWRRCSEDRGRSLFCTCQAS